MLNISNLKAAPYNPRGISPEALAGLKSSIVEFGDLSGIVWNRRSGNLVAGHQRLKSLKALHGEKLRLVEDSDRAEIQTPDNQKFPVRVVDWDEQTEKTANLAANNPHISGEFTEDLGSLLEELRSADEELFASLRLDELGEKLGVLTPEFEPTGIEDQGRLDEKKKAKCPECGCEFTP